MSYYVTLLSTANEVVWSGEANEVTTLAEACEKALAIKSAFFNEEVTQLIINDENNNPG